MFFRRDQSGRDQSGSEAAIRTVAEQRHADAHAAAAHEALMAELAATSARSSWSEPEKAPRDWVKLSLVVGLGVLSWVATYVGMLELIEANMGDLPVLHKIIIGFSVAMLMTMIVWLLDQMFAPIPFFNKLVYAAGYLFLTLISVGFGFGFYWKVLESRSESSRSAESAVTQVQSSLHAASTRLEQLSTTLIQLTQVSTAQADVERTRGASCPNSKPGDGPRRKLRDDDAARFTFASEFVKTRVGQVKSELTALDADLVKIAANDASLVDAKSGTRNDFMKALGRKLDLTVTGFNAFRTDPQLRQIRTDLAERAERTTFTDTKGGTFACPDPQLQTALRGVVRAIDQLPDLEKPKIAAVEGSEATIEAFRRLTATFYGLLAFKLPPSADELRDLQKKAVQSVETPGAQQRAILAEAVGLSKRDYIPLAIAVFVDLCLLLVSMGRPVNRLGGLVDKMRAAEKGPVIQILSRFNEIHRDPVIRQNFEVFRHVVFDFNGAYYVAVPLDAPYRFKKAHGSHGIGTAQIEELQQEAHLLANLFASFEKEKIFSRVYSPLLSTGTIRRKLWRQGSKFAGCEAFRVYRFRDGAWSELILGAVMGAAKRVEAETRVQRAEQRLARTLAGGAPSVPFGRPVDPNAVSGPGLHAADGRAWPGYGPQPGGARAPSPAGTMPQSVPRRNDMPDGSMDDRPRYSASGPSDIAPRPGQSRPGYQRPAAAPRTVTSEEAERWGPYAPYAAAGVSLPAGAPGGGEAPRRADAQVFDVPAAANANTAPAPAGRMPGVEGVAPLPANVTPLPNVMVRAQGALPPQSPLVNPPVAPPVAPGAALQRIDEASIVLTRTETISIPATAASVPAALLRGRSIAGGSSGAVIDAGATDTAAAAHAVPVAVEASAPRLAAPVIEVVSEDDIKTLRRFAPGAAE